MTVESYGDEDLEHARDQLGRSQFFKLIDGKENKIRIIRFKNADGKNRTCVKRVEHFIQGAGAPVVCKGKGCDVCIKAARLKSDADAKNQQIGKRMQAQDRMYFNIIDRNNESSGVQIMTLPPGAARQVLDLLTDKDWNTDPEGNVVPGFILDLEKGRDMKIKRFKDENNFTKYDVKPLPNPSSVSAELVSGVVNLEEFLTKGPAQKQAESKTESPATDVVHPACYQDGETFDKESAMCGECADKDSCDTKGI